MRFLDKLRKCQINNKKALLVKIIEQQAFEAKQCQKEMKKRRKNAGAN